MATNRKRLLYVQRPLGGGSATALVDLIRLLDTDRYEPIVLFHEANGYCDQVGDLGAEVQVLTEVLTEVLPEVSSWESRPSSRLRAATWPWERLATREWPVAEKLAALMRDWRIDLVHQNNNPAGNRLSILAARRARIPQVCHVRFMSAYSVPLDAIIARGTDYFIYVSGAIAQHCRNALKIASGRGEVVDDTVDLAHFTGAAAHRSRVRASLGLSEEAWVVSNVGRLVRWKGQNHFLQAFAEVIRAHPEARALIIGAGGTSAADRDYEAELGALVNSLGLRDHVIFTGFRTDVAELMAASDAVVHSSAEPEPFGRVVIEAMATGRPVIATAGGGPLEIIAEGENGHLVPMGDAHRMAAAMRRLIEEPQTAARTGRAGQRYVLERFSSERFAAQIHSVYARIAPDAVRPAAPRRGSPRQSSSSHVQVQR